MKTADFDYHLPQELIAQTPIEPRDASRLFVLRRSDGSVEHRRFRDLVDYFAPGDVLVANDSRVLPARLFARKTDSGGRVELLLVARREVDASGGEQTWEVLARPARRLRDGVLLEIADTRAEERRGGDTPRLLARVLRATPWGGRLLRFSAEGDVSTAIAARGITPLPPYIRAPLADPERYQTVYASAEGSAAAPTAGLHFTAGLIAQLKSAGVQFAFVTLHIGLDTFRPVQVEDVADHHMHSEFAELSPEAAAVLCAAKRAGRRVVAVGTTAVRVLESAAGDDGTLRPYRDWTKIFIYPGYRFKAVDALITNFHLPRSSLLMLVSAFAGRERMLQNYRDAASLGYRFYSFGDAMLLL